MKSEKDPICKRFAVNLSAYFDGELQGDPLTKLKAHLQGCAACQHELETFAKIRKALLYLSGQSGKRQTITKGDLDSAESEDDPLPC